MVFDYDNQTCTMSFEELSQLLQNSNQPSIVNYPITNSTTTWVDGKKLCEIFPSLAYNNVKSSKWRIKNQFPYYQDGPYALVTYNIEEVRYWMEQHIKVKHTAQC